MGNLNIRETLKEGTRDLHEQTERSANAHLLSSASDGLSTYEGLIVCNQFIYANVERQIAQFLTQCHPAYLSRFHLKKHIWLNQDLSQAQLHPIETFVHRLPEVKSLAEVAGMMYVLEGSMLGGRMIRKWLLQNDQLDACRPFYFYRGHDQKSGQVWSELLNTLEEIIDSPSSMEQALLAARRTFLFFTQIYSDPKLKILRPAPRLTDSPPISRIAKNDSARA